MRDRTAASPEWNLLLTACTARSRCALEVSPSLESIDWSAIDQQKLISLSVHHGVIPQLYGFLSEEFGEIIPEQLRIAHAENVRRSMWFAAEMSRVIGHVRARGIRTLAYKGPLLADILYGDVAARQYNDLDFLVLSQDVPSARTELQHLGYRTTTKLSKRQEQEYLRSGYEYSFDSPAGANLLELHWQIQPRFYAVNIATEDLFNRAISVPFNGCATVETISPEDLLIVLCVHAAKHAFMRLSMLCDIARLAQSQNLDWTIIRERTSHFGLGRIMSVTFELARRLLQFPVPAVIEINGSARSLADQISLLIENYPEVEFDPTSPAYFQLMLRLRERRSDQAKFLWRLFSTPSIGEWDAVSLPDSLFPLYRVVRAGRLAHRLVSTVL
jgi:hypothetical protein